VQRELILPINCTATAGGITKIPTSQSATASDITKQFVTVRSLLVVITATIIRVLPTWKRKQKYDNDDDDDDDDDDDNSNNNREEYRGIRRKMDDNYCMKTKKTRKLDNVWTAGVDDKDLCLLAFGENMTKMTYVQWNLSEAERRGHNRDLSLASNFYISEDPNFKYRYEKKPPYNGGKKSVLCCSGKGRFHCTWNQKCTNLLSSIHLFNIRRLGVKLRHKPWNKWNYSEQ